MKNTYSPPGLITYGDVEEITRGSALGDHLDRTFPEGTPGEELTFSGGETGDYDPNDDNP